MNDVALKLDEIHATLLIAEIHKLGGVTDEDYKNYLVDAYTTILKEFGVDATCVKKGEEVNE